MYYILRDFQDLNPTKTRRLKLGGSEVVVTKNAMYAKENVYILPKSNGTFIIAGREFFRNDRGILVKTAETY